jgi:DNA-binding NarL/FixJ family response regulator
MTMPAPDREPSSPLSVMLVEQLALVRAGLRLLIGSHPGLSVVGEAESADEALEAMARIPRGGRGVALVSLGLDGDRDAFWLIRSIRERFTGFPILAMGVGPRESDVSKALFFGADGFVHKRIDPDLFVDAIRRTASGEVVLAGVEWESVPAVAAALDHHRVQPAQPFLTVRQNQIIVLAAEGLTSRQIGTRLGVRERTVTTHLSRIYGKLHVRNRAEAVVAAARSGLVRVRVEG